MARSHAIRRQVIEVTVPDRDAAHRIMPLISALARDRMTSVLERVFDDLAPDGSLVRIDRLELDLGHVRIEELPDRLLERLASALPGAVRRTATPTMRPREDVAAGRPDASAPLLVLSQFARGGGLPWWSDIRQTRTLDDAVTAAFTTDPAGIARLVRAWAGEAAALDRLIVALTDESLHRLLRAVLPAAESVALALVAATDRIPAVVGFTPRRRRLLIWRGLLRGAVRGGLVEGGLIEAALTEIGIALGSTLASLAADLAALPGSGDAELMSSVQALAARLPEPGARTGFVDPRPAFARLAAAHPELRALADRLARLAERLPVAEEAACAAALDAMAASGATPATVAALLRPFVRAGLLRPDDVRDELAPLANAEAEAAVTAEAPPPPSEEEGSRIVATAGLCLLWPFLPRFFRRLDMLDEPGTGFVTPAAAHRAAQLLHFLATGEQDAPDFALTLPKTLCGLPPHMPHAVTEPVTPAEAEEAEQLLTAAIAHAACLGDISPDGLRGSFLVRSGILTTRDGAWLLRVEREAPDVLLERLPWTMEWVRLPWMQAPMRVEW